VEIGWRDVHAAGDRRLGRDLSISVVSRWNGWRAGEKKQRMRTAIRGKIVLVNGQRLGLGGHQSGPGAPHHPSVDVVIVAEDDEEIRDLKMALQNRGSVVESAHDSEAIARAVVGGRPDAIVVDLRDNDGLSERLLSWVCRNAPAPALVLTDLSDTGSRLRALELGAADHLVAPFDVREGVARVERLVARRRAGRRRCVEAGDMTIDVAQRSVVRNGETVSLTPREIDVLGFLVERRGTTVSKAELLDSVWSGEIRSENVVEANVSSLRRKLHALGPPVIHTVHRSGYVFRPETPSVTAARVALIAERDRMVRERDEIIARRDEVIHRLRSERGRLQPGFHE
jgi:two-component system, OmpR family, response regulator